MAKSKLLLLIAVGIFLYKLACAFGFFFSELVEQMLILGSNELLMAHILPSYIDLILYLLFIWLGGNKILKYILTKKDIPFKIFSVLFLVYLGGELLNFLLPFLQDFYPEYYFDQLKAFQQTRKDNPWLIELSTTLPLAFLQTLGLFLMFYVWIKRSSRNSA